MIEFKPAAEAVWYPLSSGQLAMWLVDRSGVARAAYAVPACYELTGRLDVVALRRAFEELLARNESLRTAIADVDGTPMQRVVPDARLDWEVVAAPGDSRELVEEFISREFDLSAGRVLRVLLVERSDTEHTLVVVYRPKGKHAFAAVTISPITGVISGMNDAGLAVTINEISLRQSADKATFDNSSTWRDR